MNAAMSLQQNSTTRATSSGTPIRPERVGGDPGLDVDAGVGQRRHLVAHARRVDDRRSDAEHPDAERSELEGQRLGDADDGVLRGDVGADPGARLEPGGGGEVDDDPAVAHAPGGLARAGVGAADVHLQHAVEERVVGVDGRSGGREDGGVVDPDLEAAELGDGAIGGSGERRGVGDVELAADDLAAHHARRHGPGVGGVAVEVAGDHARPLPRRGGARSARRDRAPAPVTTARRPASEISSASVRSLTSGTATGRRLLPLGSARATLRRAMSERDADAIRRSAARLRRRRARPRRGVRGVRCGPTTRGGTSGRIG